MTLASLVVPPGGQGEGGEGEVNYVHSQSWKPHLTASQSTSSFKQGHPAKQIKNYTVGQIGLYLDALPKHSLFQSLSSSPQPEEGPNYSQPADIRGQNRRTT